MRVLTALLWFSWQAVAAPHVNLVRCGGGGEGPKPFQDISGKLLSGVSLIPTPGGLQDFIFWERANTLLYRGTNSDLNALYLPSTQPHVFAKAKGALSRLIDPEGRFLLTDTGNWVFDTRGPGWSHFGVAADRKQDLFWSEGRLYEVGLDQKDSFPIFEYQPGEPSARFHCAFRPEESGLKLAHGHQYPFLFLYGERESEEGKVLSIYKVDARTCELETRLDFDRPMEAPVLDVYRFENQEATAIKLDTPTHTLVWASATSPCQSFELDGLEPLITNYQVPVITAWSSKTDGITFFNLEAEKRATLLKGLSLSRPSERDVWWNEKADRLFLSARVKGASERSLLEVRILR